MDKKSCRCDKTSERWPEPCEDTQHGEQEGKMILLVFLDDFFTEKHTEDTGYEDNQSRHNSEKVDNNS